ncbi:MlaE family ABC transporter permease [Pararobbsia silviterrae]|uniref:ABC transporter permease n=1 Tax=Pararobbsia silviterrae TaxID=1792498 RepID=A0A494Y9G2_9BURK|nr:ABC transporter permease [Pararobbsia silviterrae]RKP58765.1 ABC transporter permease [Pararobbsia silviterrae]
MDFDTPPQLQIDTGDHGPIVRLSGQWTALALALDEQKGGVGRKIRQLTHVHAHEWDLSGIERLDHSGGQALWRVWGRQWPAAVRLTDMQRQIFDRIAALDAQYEKPDKPERIDIATALGFAIFRFLHHMTEGIILFGSVIVDAFHVLRGARRFPLSDVSANVFSAGARALPITALVGFLIGIVLSYLSSQQLRMFGASTYIVNVLGLTIIRELGPVLAAILVAGRSGSAITAQIGVMRVTEELDAMQVMGIPHSLRLVFPRVIALAIAMPLLVLWTDIIALLGGAMAAHFALDIDMTLFVHQLPNVVPIRNVWIGLLKGVVFGMLIALTGCHFGFRIKPNSQSLGEGTTSSVVASITVVILADAVFAIMFQRVGLR